ARGPAPPAPGCRRSRARPVAWARWCGGWSSPRRPRCSPDGPARPPTGPPSDCDRARGWAWLGSNRASLAPGSALVALALIMPVHRAGRAVDGVQAGFGLVQLAGLEPGLLGLEARLRAAMRHVERLPGRRPAGLLLFLLQQLAGVGQGLLRRDAARRGLPGLLRLRHLLAGGLLRGGLLRDRLRRDLSLRDLLRRGLFLRDLLL